MEYCEGNTLRQLIERDILQEKPSMIWMLLREILEGLKHMHLKVQKSFRFLFVSIDLNIVFDLCLGNHTSRFKTGKYSFGFNWTCKNWRFGSGDNQYTFSKLKKKRRFRR